MKTTKYILLTIVLLTVKDILAQPSSSQNYVMTNTVKQAGITNEGMIPALPIATQGKGQTISYFDGLGRPLQTVVTQGGTTQKDIIAGTEYDVFGREIKKYLPYADISNTVNPGSYKTGWQTTQASFYNGQLQGVDADAAPYSQSVLEASPLNRLLAQGAPGTVWQPNMANAYDATKKTIQAYYEINTVADNVRIFNVDMATGNINSPAFYTAGLLSVKRTIDEHQGVVKEFTDKMGHLILKQVYTETDVLQTYYIYDDLDLLRGVIQPEGVAAIPASGGWSPDATFIDRWIFQYTYDARNRMIVKKVPGAVAVYMMYDKWDRLVLTQDGRQRSDHLWLFTKYDALNRPIITGMITDARTQSAIQTSIDASGRFETVNNAAMEGYTLNSSFPAQNTILGSYTITHYDSYANIPYWIPGQYAYVAEYGLPAKNDNLQGQVVATQTKVLNSTGDMLWTLNYYDDKYRLIQTISDNRAGGKDRLTRILSFDGKPTQEYHSHTSSVYTTALVTKRSYTYDHADRVLKITHKIGAGEEIILAENAYNELGQLLNKKIHQSTTFTTPLQKLDYSYNIRGWLNGINKPYSDATGYDETDLFNFELHYNTTSLSGAAAQFNGNIAEQVWKGGYDEYLRGYKYGYDKANRLKTSGYGFKYLNASNNMIWDFSSRYDENITSYDKNGNIKHLDRFHGSWGKVDDLTYTYYEGNKLSKVADNVAGTVPAGFTDRSNGGNDYQYDNNGSVYLDYNKGINYIEHNHLNLVTLVDFGSAKGTIEYLYDAAGNKLQKTVTDKTVSPNKISITKYAGAFVYSNTYLSGITPPVETLEFITHEEGRIRPAKIDEAQPLNAVNTKYIYDYFMKDHLGNTRMVLTTEQQTDVYAATQEPANATKETQLFSNLSSTTFAKPAGGAGFDAIAANTKVSKINGGSTSTRIGPGIVLKVMAGDVISLSTQAWYTGSTQAPPAGLGPIKDQLLTLLSAGIVANNGTHGGTIPLTDINAGAGAVLDDFLNGQTYDNSKPKAFLNWLIVDEEFKKVTSSFHMGAVQVPLITGAMQKQQLTGPANMTVRRNGWLYVYVSNESNQDVYFDDLVVNHKRGPVVEANNYYAFGLQIPGISSKALGFGGVENRRKFNGGNELQSKEFSDGAGLDWYDAHFRMYDPQIGRFMQLDAFDGLSVSNSLYAFADNNPILLNDPLGLLSTKENPQVLQEVVVTAHKKKTYNNFLNIPYYSKADSKGFANDNGLYSQRKNSNQPLLQGGESDWYKNHLRKMDLNYQANKEWKTNSITAVLLIGSPILLTSTPALSVLTRPFLAAQGKYGAIAKVAAWMQLGNAGADLTYQTIKFSITGDNINVASTIGNLYFTNPLLSSLPGAIADPQNNFFQTWGKGAIGDAIGNIPIPGVNIGARIGLEGFTLPLLGNLSSDVFTGEFKKD